MMRSVDDDVNDGIRIARQWTQRALKHNLLMVNEQ